MKRFSFPRGIAVLFLSLISWLVIGPVMMIALSDAPGRNEYILMHIPYITLFLSLLIFSRLILGNTLRSMLSGDGSRFRYRFSVECGIIYMIATGILTPLFSGGIARNSIDVGEYLFSSIPVLVLTPMQATAEEVFFRALPKGIVYGDKSPKTLIEALPLIAGSGIVFALFHSANSEVIAAANFILPLLAYFLWGSLAMFISLATDGFEASTAMHIVNNLFIALVINYSGSSMPTEALFTASSAGSVSTIAETIIVFIIVYLYSWKTGHCRKGFCIK